MSTKSLRDTGFFEVLVRLLQSVSKEERAQFLEDLYYEVCMECGGIRDNSADVSDRCSCGRWRP